MCLFFFSSRRRHTRWPRDWSSDVCSSDLQIGAVLSGRQLAINERGEALAERITGTLSPAQRTTWQAIGPYGTNQLLGEAVVHFCLRILTLRGIVCLAPRSGNKAPFVLLDE